MLVPNVASKHNWRDVINNLLRVKNKRNDMRLTPQQWVTAKIFGNSSLFNVSLFAPQTILAPQNLLKRVALRANSIPYNNYMRMSSQTYLFQMFAVEIVRIYRSAIYSSSHKASDRWHCIDTSPTFAARLECRVERLNDLETWPSQEAGCTRQKWIRFDDLSNKMHYYAAKQVILQI